MARQAAERGGPCVRQLGHELLEGVTHAGPDGGDVVEVDTGRRLGREGPHQGLGQVDGCDPGQDVGRHIDEPVFEAGHAGMGATGDTGHAVELGRRVLERLALEQTGEQRVPLGVQQQLLVEVGVVPAREQALGLELDQGGGDEEELGGEVEVEALHALELDQVAVDDAAQRDLVDVDLLAGDEVEQEVERALEDGRADLVRHSAQATEGCGRSRVPLRVPCGDGARALGDTALR